MKSDKPIIKYMSRLGRLGKRSKREKRFDELYDLALEIFLMEIDFKPEDHLNWQQANEYKELELEFIYGEEKA